MLKLKKPLKNIIEFFKENDWNFGALLLGLLALILDVIGFSMMFEENGMQGSLIDYLYLSIRVFGFDLQTPSIDTHIPWVLELGRWLSGGVTVYVVLQTVAHLFNTKLQLFRRGKGHIVIVGAGSKAKALANSWFEKINDSNHSDYKKLLVFIEKDKNNPDIDLLKEKGAVFIFGDGSDKEILKKANAEQASYFVTLTSDDATNIEILSTYIDIVPNTKNVKCYVHILHNEFYDFFRAKKFNPKKRPNVDIKVFNLYSNSARMLMQQKLLGSNLFVDEKSIKDKNNRLKVALFGFEKLAENVLVHILQLGHFYNENPIEVTVIYDKDRDKNKNLEDEFFKQYDILNHAYNGVYWKVEFIDDGDIVKREFDYHHVIIVYEDEFESLSNLMKILKRYNDKIIENDIDISIYSNAFKNTANVIQSDEDEVFKHVRTFGEIDKTCNYEIVINESLDNKAILNNKYYNELHDCDDKTKSAKEEWRSLDIFLKDSNRYLVEHNEIKKDIINKLIENREPLQSYEEMKEFVQENFYDYNGMKINWDDFKVIPKEYAQKLSKEELVQLAKLEHNRWNAFQILNGWKSMSLDTLSNKTKDLIGHEAKNGNQKDKIKKLHSCIVGYKELDNVSKVMEHNYKSDDIETVMRIPSLEIESTVVKENI